MVVLLYSVLLCLFRESRLFWRLLFYYLYSNVVLVHQPVQSVGISVAVMLHIKTQCEGNGSVLVKHCNAEMEHHSIAQRVDLSASMALLHSS